MGYFFAYSVIKTCNSKKITDWDKKTFEVEGISWKKINFATDFDEIEYYMINNSIKQLPGATQKAE